MPDLLKYFRIEARDLLAKLQGCVGELDGDARLDLAERVHRFAHTLKGSARLVALADVSETAGRLEQIAGPEARAEGIAPEDHAEVRTLVEQLARQLQPVLDAAP